MKLLVYTISLPSEKEIRVRYIDALVNSLNKLASIKIIWILGKPEKTKNFKSENMEIYNFHDFDNTVEMLTILKPDIVLGSAAIEVLEYSFALASNYLHIPLISFAQLAMVFNKIETPEKNTQFFRRFFSSSAVTNSSEAGKFLGRSRFFLSKLLFLLRTKKAIKMNFFQIIKSTLNELPHQTLLREPLFNTISDIYIAHHESQVTELINKGVKKEKIQLIGHPLLDDLHDNFLKFQQQKLPPTLRILIITDSLFEHGLWSGSQRLAFLKTLFNILKRNNIQFSLKIHPTSESMSFYQNLLRELNLNSPVYQLENMWEIMSKHNLVLTYGFSTTHTELSYVGMKTILIDPGIKLPRFPLVQEGIRSGHIRECHDLKNLLSIINEHFNSEIILSNEFLSSRKELFVNFDGKSAQRIANEIINLVNKIK